MKAKKRKLKLGRIKVMAKAKKKAVAEAAEAVVTPARIKVKALNQKYRGARAAWYARLLEYNGKEAKDYLQSCKENCPQVTKSGEKEDPRGWMNWFIRNGIMELEVPNT
jgi:hypothetical protein